MTDTGLAHGDSSRPNEGLLGDSRRKLNEGNRLVELKAEIASALSLADKHSTSPHSPKTSEKDSGLASELSSKCVVSVPIAQHLNSLPSTEQSASTNARALAPEELTRSESKSSIVSQSDTYPCAASPAPTDTSRASASPLTNDSASSIAASPVAVPRLSLSKLVTEPTDSYPTKSQSEPVSEAAWNAAVTRLERALSLPEPAMSRACRTLFVQLQREGWTQAEVSHLYWCALCELNPRLASLNS